MKAVTPVKETHEFSDRDFVAGHASIDFVNTVTGRNGHSRDWLAEPASLSAWAVKAGVATEVEAQQLTRLYRQSPKTGEAVLQQAVVLREAMFAFLNAVTQGSSPPSQYVAAIGRVWQEAASVAPLDWSAAGLVPKPRTTENLIIHRIVLDILGLGATLASSRLRRCVGHDCGWFFLDTSKAGRRRWCDMATCGNAAKYSRSRA